MIQSKEDITSTLIKLAAARFSVEATLLSADADFFDALGIDSVQAMEMLTEIEETFDVEVPDYEVQNVKTFTALAEVIGRRV